MLLVYADGGVPAKGAGAYWQVGILDERGNRILTERAVSATLRTSGEAECAAIRDALSRVLRLPEPQEITVFSDCQSLVAFLNRPKGGSLRRAHASVAKRRLLSLRAETVRLFRLLSQAGHRVAFQWVPRQVIVSQLGH